MSFSVDLDEHSGISLILLRSVLECFGDYKVIGQSEYYEDGKCYEAYHTNLPKENFIEVVGKRVSIEDWSEMEDYSRPVEM